ncbi:MAG TPA: bacterial transcriptional activator domain-containing protein [Jiangellaceae bacterium]|nr:bacterial transcriptional activator domain-containing protein [Jiangellaceae bacterium]
MALTIHLLGRPSILHDSGTTHPMRGHKAWGLLAYLASGRSPVPRQRLVDLLFTDADDPMGALRWNLSQLRRALGGRAEVTGDPVRLSLPPETMVDVHLVTRGSWVEAVDVPGLGLPLLAGMSFDASPAFQFWLDGERRHLMAASETVLQDAARARLAHGDPAAAVTDATRLVELNPLDENSHVLLILALRAAGAHDQAAEQARACRELLQRELGIDAGPTLQSALDSPSADRPRRSDRPTVVARIDAGESAVNVGALAAGLDTLRRAVWDARTLGDPNLLARALITLGSALVHAARGTDEEGAAGLLEGAGLAVEAGDTELASMAQRELAYIAVLRGQYQRALGWLDRARELADGHDRQLAWIELISGKAHTDLGKHAVARRQLETAIAAAADTGDRYCHSYALASLGRLLILREEWAEADAALTTSIRLTQEDGRLSFRPYPEALLGDVRLATGDLDAAAATFDSAYALGRQIGDPCWESLAERGAGLVAIRRGDRKRGLELLGEAPRVCRRLPDTYLWIAAYGQEARNEAAIDARAPGAGRWVAELEAFSARHELRELQARAAMQRIRLGDAGALEVAQALVAEVDNPALSARLTSLA